MDTVDTMTEPLEQAFRRMLKESKEIVLDALESSSSSNEDEEFIGLDEEFIPVAARAERLVKSKLLEATEAQEAPVVLALAQLLPGSSLQSLFTSLRRCLDVKATAKESLMELLLSEEHDFTQLFRQDGQGIFQLQAQLLAAQPTATRPAKRRRTHTEYRASYWKVSLAYVLSQLAYDDMSRLPFEIYLQDLLDRTQKLARPFGMHNSDLLVAAHTFFLLDLLVDPLRKAPVGLSLEHVSNELTARQ